MSAHPNVAPAEAEQVSVRLMTDPPDKMEYPALARMYVSIHVGRAVFMSCSRGGQKHRGLGVHGDIDIIPALTPCVWEPEDYDTVLAVGMQPGLVAAVAQDLGVYPDQVEIRNRFQIRDPQIENIGWALKAEMEAAYPVGRILRESLGTALAARSRLDFHIKAISPAICAACWGTRQARCGDRPARQASGWNLNAEVPGLPLEASPKCAAYA